MAHELVVRILAEIEFTEPAKTLEEEAMRKLANVKVSAAAHDLQDAVRLILSQMLLVRERE